MDTSQPANTSESAPGPEPSAGSEELKARIIAALKTVFDPEIPVSLYDLGLIYKIEVDEAGGVQIDMTLTSPACPVAGSLPGDVESKVRDVPGVTGVKVELVWDPPWDMSKLSEAARLQLDV